MVNPFGCTKQFDILQLPISYCVSLIMATITNHVFINFFQIEHFWAVKFDWLWEKHELSCDTMQNLKNFKGKLKKLDWPPLIFSERKIQIWQ